MEEVIEKAASSLAPLMIVLGVVAGVLIGLALILRMRLARERRALGQMGRAPAGGARTRPEQAAPGQALSVLGRAFQVEARAELGLDRGPAVLLALADGRGTARLLLDRDGKRVVRFSSHEPGPSEPGWPDVVARNQGKCTRRAGPAQAGEGWRLALYASSDELYLLLEERAGARLLWVGRPAPLEGLEVLEDSA